MNLLVFVKVCHESKECMVIQSFNIICLILLEYITHVNVQQDLQHAAEDAIEASAGLNNFIITIERKNMLLSTTRGN